ncbi:MAG: ribosomal protein S18-alanine N-acetyltransferase [Bacilli bacterium]|nr:ribosomal protein S18-alanine N-acetyltransferase [Bacilli bacterium]
MEITIRNMRISDVATIAKYDMVLLGETLGEETIKSHLENSDLMRYLIMEEKETKEIIGQISLWIDEDKAQINNFYIIKKYQRMHLGKSFMDYVMKYLGAIHVKEITLEVRASNEPAIKLYESFDFKVVTVRKNYYSNGEDAFLMYVGIGSD